MSGSFFRLCLPGLIALSLALGVLTLPESSRAEEPPAPAISEAAVRAADEATIRQLTEQWFAAWSPGLGPVNWEAMAQLFVPGAGNLLVFDDAGGRVVVLDSWTDYRKTWEPFMAQFARWQIEPEGDIRVIVAGDLAVATFVLTGGGIDRAGNAIQFRQYGTHVWQRCGDRWAIVREHLTTDG